MSLVRVTKPVGNQGRQLRAPAAGSAGDVPLRAHGCSGAGQAQPAPGHREERSRGAAEGVCLRCFLLGGSGPGGMWGGCGFPMSLRLPVRDMESPWCSRFTPRRRLVPGAPPARGATMSHAHVTSPKKLLGSLTGPRVPQTPHQNPTQASWPAPPHPHPAPGSPALGQGLCPHGCLGHTKSFAITGPSPGCYLGLGHSSPREPEGWLLAPSRSLLRVTSSEKPSLTTPPETTKGIRMPLNALVLPLIPEFAPGVMYSLLLVCPPCPGDQEPCEDRDRIPLATAVSHYLAHSRCSTNEKSVRCCIPST